jgi:LCP family protein required for cell wall assembly
MAAVIPPKRCEMSCRQRLARLQALIFLLLAGGILVSCLAQCSIDEDESSPTQSPIQNPTQVALLPFFIRGSQPTRTPFQPLPPTPYTPAPLPTSLPPTATETPFPILLSTPLPASFSWPPPNYYAPGAPPVTAVPSPYPLFSDAETVNFLLVGSDRRDYDFRTDTLVIASLRPRQHSVTLISIPRDLFVYIPGWTMQRINTAYFQGELIKYPNGGGPGLLKDTILYNLGVRIDHLALVEFNGFRQIIDTVDGIDVPVACEFSDMRKMPSGYWRMYTVGPGVVHMNGDLALWYARARSRSSDFDRGRRQQEMLRALYTRGLQLDILPRLPELYDNLRAAIATDLTLQDLLALVPQAANLDSPRIRSFFINRTYVSAWRTPDGAAVQLPKHAALQAMLQQAMAAFESVEKEKPLLVEIQNGTASLDWDVLAATRLHYAGYETRLTQAEQNNYNTSILYDFTLEQDPQQSEALLQVLGLPASSLVANADPAATSAYRLILGADYNPCFDPANLAH